VGFENQTRQPSRSPADRLPLLIPLSHAAALHVSRAHGEIAFSSGDSLPELGKIASSCCISASITPITEAEDVSIPSTTAVGGESPGDQFAAQHESGDLDEQSPAPDCLCRRGIVVNNDQFPRNSAQRGFEEE
jgi:hypothetical protein